MGHAVLTFRPAFLAQKSLSKDTALYHIFPFKTFEQVIKNQSLCFRKIVKWPDTYEYPIRLMPESRKKVIEKRLFGFCLTRRFDKEAMWKMYSGEDGCGICIKTTVSSFCQAIRNVYTNAFIGNVQYVSYLENNPEKMFDEKIKFEYPDYMYPAYLKRDAFSYEEEVRLLVYETEDILNTVRDHLKVGIENMQFIHEIILSPYYQEDKKTEVFDLCKKYNISPQIYQSGLINRMNEDGFLLPGENEVYWGRPMGGYDVLV